MSEIILQPIEPKTKQPFAAEWQSPGMRDEWIFQNGEQVQNIIFTDKEIIVLGIPEREPEGLSDEEYKNWYETSHNCDALGCGQCHVLRRKAFCQIASLQSDLAASRAENEQANQIFDKLRRFWTEAGNDHLLAEIVPEVLNRFNPDGGDK